jgi:putative FmdB family regulatory protein
MPTYEYQCGSCGHAFERFEPITAGARKKCPACGKTARRCIGSGAGVLFRGSGFYQTDYRSKEYKQRAKSETDSGTKKTETKSDAAKSETKNPGGSD